jgi:hypothetical protein
VQRDGAVHSTAHRDRDTARHRLRDEDLAECGRECLDRERLAGHARRLEQSQPRERALERIRVALDDAVAVDREPYTGPVAVPRRVSEDLSSHRLRLARRFRRRAPPCR